MPKIEITWDSPTDNQGTQTINIQISVTTENSDGNNISVTTEDSDSNNISVTTEDSDSNNKKPPDKVRNIVFTKIGDIVCNLVSNVLASLIKP